MKLITTSWDDGHPLDFKLAEMLHKYQLAATFYIPKNNPGKKVMSEKQIQKLAQHFEIGAHTLNHIKLDSDNKAEIAKEVYGSFLWLEDLLGYEPESFCFPDGKYNHLSIAEVFESGFKVARTTELLCTNNESTLNILPTTLQVYERSAFTHIKHLLKRRRFHSLIHFLALNTSYKLLKLAENYLRDAKDGGFFHLWGHSWEIEEYNLWNKLDALMCLLANSNESVYIENRQLPDFYHPQQKNKITNTY